MEKFRVYNNGYNEGFQIDFDNGVTVSVQFGIHTQSDKGQTTAEVAVFRGTEWYFADIDDLVLVENGTEVMAYCSPDVVAWIIDRARKIK
jgi:hypothetical protein